MPLNSRQKIILRFMLKQREAVRHTALMKWLFLFSRKHPSSVSSYDFVPYKFGPYSFEAQQNINQTLAHYIENTAEGYQLRSGVQSDVLAATHKITKLDELSVDQIWSEYNSLSNQDLLKRVYSAYPWYASRSELLMREPQQDADLAIYTSGYEGRSIDAFLNSLLNYGIRGVLDVRRNAYSHKYGFSGPALRDICNKLGVEYNHLPELGVASELRKDLTGPDAYTKLFDDYEAGLPRRTGALREAGEIIRKRPTTLMCFEASSECCHRGRLAPKLSSQINLPVKHL